MLGFPCLFVLLSWLYSGGLPYYVDSNETFLSFLEAKNMVLWDPTSFSFLPSETTDPRSPTVTSLYSHNPNFPRYLDYALLLAGIAELPPHVLIIATTATGLSMWLVFRLLSSLFGMTALAQWIAVPLSFTLDYAGFLSFSVNTYRVFEFVLFWACVSSITIKWSLFATFIVFFVLFQLEYAFAMFVVMTCLILSLLSRRVRLRQSLGAVTGAGLSVAIFLEQVLHQYGVQGLIDELRATYLRRGPGPEAQAGPVQVLKAELRQVSDTISASLGTIDLFYGPVVRWLIVWAVISSLLVLVASIRRRRRESPTFPGRVRLFLTQLLTSMLAGGLVTGTLLHGYFVDAYLRSALPFFAFFVAVSLGVVSLDLTWLGRRLMHRDRQLVAAVAPVLVLVPLVANSAMKFHLPFNGAVIDVLEHQFQGKSFIAPFRQHHLVFALTGGPTLASGGPADSPVVRWRDLKNFESFRGPTGELYYVCLDLTSGATALFEGQSQGLCAPGVQSMTHDGHTVVQQGPGYVIMALRRPDENTPGRDEAVQRDAQRTADLLRLRASLLDYYRAHNHFPCTGDNGWEWSTRGPDWLVDNPRACGIQAQAEAIPGTPTDPLNIGPEPWLGGSMYGYRASRERCPPQSNGQFYLIVAGLEVGSAPPELSQARDCDGQVITWPKGVIALSGRAPVGAQP